MDTHSHRSAHIHSKPNTHTFNKNFNNSSESSLLCFDKNNISVRKKKKYGCHKYFSVGTLKIRRIFSLFYLLCWCHRGKFHSRIYWFDAERRKRQRERERQRVHDMFSFERFSLHFMSKAEMERNNKLKAKAENMQTRKKEIKIKNRCEKS